MPKATRRRRGQARAAPHCVPARMLFAAAATSSPMPQVVRNSSEAFRAVTMITRLPDMALIELSTIARLRNELLSGFRRFYADDGTSEVHVPTLVGITGACE